MRNTSGLFSIPARSGRSRQFLILWILALSAGCSGEGPDVVHRIRGHVSLDGQPLTAGNVRFTDPATGFAAFGAIADDGSYELNTGDAGVPPGDYEVAISPPTPETDDVTAPTPEELQELQSSKSETSSVIPPKYHQYETSGLRAKVESGANEFDFDLTSR